MSNIIASENVIPSMGVMAIDKVRALETEMRKMPQGPVDTHHVLHAGQYARTVMIPAGTLITGALIKIATILIVCGDCTVFVGDDVVRLTGYNVMATGARRKQAFIAHSDTYLTMVFATKAETIEQAEDEFTDEGDMLLSRSEVGRNTILITGE